MTCFNKLQICLVSCFNTCIYCIKGHHPDCKHRVVCCGWALNHSRPIPETWSSQCCKGQQCPSLLTYTRFPFLISISIFHLFTWERHDHENVPIIGWAHNLWSLFCFSHNAHGSYFVWFNVALIQSSVDRFTFTWLESSYMASTWQDWRHCKYV